MARRLHTELSNNKCHSGKPTEMFCNSWITKKIVIDNATVFVGEEFQVFMSRQGIQHITNHRNIPLQTDWLKDVCISLRKG